MSITPEANARLEAAGHQAALSYVDALADQRTPLLAEQYERSLDQVLGQAPGQNPAADEQS